jgi:hypothetical protein
MPAHLISGVSSNIMYRSRSGFNRRKRKFRKPAFEELYNDKVVNILANIRAENQVKNEEDAIKTTKERPKSKRIDKYNY